MAAQLDDIVILIEARLDRLEASMKEAERIVDRSVDRMDQSLGRGGGGFFFFGGKGIRPAVSRQLASIAAFAASIKVADIAMKNLLETGNLFSGSLDDVIEKIFKMGAAIRDAPIFRPFRTATRALDDFILTIREMIELVAGEKFTPEGPSENRFLQFIDALLGGNALIRREEGQAALRNQFNIGVRDQRIAALAEQELRSAKDKEDRINILARIELEQIKVAEELLQKARRELFPDDARKLPKDLFDILRGNVELRRQNALDALKGGGERAFQIQTFQTPLGTARFAGGENALDRIAVATEKTADNTKANKAAE